MYEESTLARPLPPWRFARDADRAGARKWTRKAPEARPEALSCGAARRRLAHGALPPFSGQAGAPGTVARRDSPNLASGSPSTPPTPTPRSKPSASLTSLRRCAPRPLPPDVWGRAADPGRRARRPAIGLWAVHAADRGACSPQRRDAFFAAGPWRMGSRACLSLVASDNLRPIRQRWPNGSHECCSTASRRAAPSLA